MRSRARCSARGCRTCAEIPDLKNPEEILRVTGEAEGPTSEFFAFIDKSPVIGMIDHFTESWQAGPGSADAQAGFAAACSRQGSDPGGGRLPVHRQHRPCRPGSAADRAGERAHRVHPKHRARAGDHWHLAGGPVTISATTQRDSGVLIAVQGASAPKTSRTLRAAVAATCARRDRLAGELHRHALRGRCRNRIQPAGSCRRSAGPR